MSWLAHKVTALEAENKCLRRQVNNIEHYLEKLQQHLDRGEVSAPLTPTQSPLGVCPNLHGPMGTKELTECLGSLAKALGYKLSFKGSVPAKMIAEKIEVKDD